MSDISTADGQGGQDRKFKFEDGQFVNRVSGEPHSEHDLRVAQEFRAGDRDDDEFAIAFARHRHDSTREMAEAGQALYDAIGSWKPPEHGFLTKELIEAGERWIAALATLQGTDR